MTDVAGVIGAIILIFILIFVLAFAIIFAVWIAQDHLGFKLNVEVINETHS